MAGERVAVSGCDVRVRGLLVCPLCRGELSDVPDALACAACGAAWPVVDGVPWLVPEHRRGWSADAVDPAGSDR